ncbi:MAG: hypothetical protein ACOCR6_03185 [archaeon]
MEVERTLQAEAAAAGSMHREQSCGRWRSKAERDVSGAGSLTTLIYK